MSAPKGTRPWNAGRARWRINAWGYRVRRRLIDGHEVEERESRLIMEQMLKRPLLPTEHVRHRDGNRANNAPANLYLTKPGSPGEKKMRKIVATVFMIGFLTRSIDCTTANWQPANLISLLRTLKIPYVEVPTNNPATAIIVYPNTTPPQIGYKRLFVFTNDADFCAKLKGLEDAVKTLAPE